MMSLNFLPPAPSKKLRGPLLLEFSELGLEGLKPRPRLGPDGLVVRLCLRRLEAHPPLRVLDRPSEGFPSLREFLELHPDPMVSLLLRQKLARSRFRKPRERGMDAGHPRIRAAPPPQAEQRHRQSDEPSREVSGRN